MSGDSKNARRETLTDMWHKTAQAILRALDADEPTAASLEVSRKFLTDNSTTLDAIRQWSNHPLGFDPHQLPKFDDPNEDTGQSTEADPLLRVIPDFDNS